MSEIVTDILRDSSPVDEGAAARPDRAPALAHRGRSRAARSSRCGRSRSPRPASGSARCCCCATSSELRRREQELLTKDATIREIHHRVKNNLQSVAALLRLQARRTDDEQARAALQEAERRVGHHRPRPRHPEQGLRRDRRLRRGRRPGLPRGRRGGRLRQADRAGAHRRLVRPAARRGRHVARDDPQRARPERHRARLPGRHRRHRHGRRQTGGRRPWRSGRADREDHRRRGRHRYGTPARIRPGYADRPVPRAGPAGDHPVVARRNRTARRSPSPRPCARSKADRPAISPGGQQ